MLFTLFVSAILKSQCCLSKIDNLNTLLQYSVFHIFLLFGRILLSASAKSANFKWVCISNGQVPWYIFDLGKKVSLAFDALWEIKSWTVLSNDSFGWVEVKWPWVFHLLEKKVTAFALTAWSADCVITRACVCVCVGGLLSYGPETPLRGLIHQ